LGHIYQPADREIVARHGEVDWVGRVRNALADKRFCLYAQDMVAVPATHQSERHQELLLRMVDENQEIVEPMAFIPVAERYNLWSPIDGTSVLRRHTESKLPFA
jgi:EAL domain-containing protein (putative c-di-GMP-specific phosphodiesterase class I)